MRDSKNVHIAFAEDHASVREAIVLFLNLLGGITIDIEADNGTELLHKLGAANELPDICMIDYQMPVMDGHSLLIQIRRRWPDMKILVFTSFGNEALIIRMIKAGANGYLLKSCKPEIIKEALISIHSTGYYYTEQASSIIFHLVENNTIKTPHFTEREIEFIKYSCTDLNYTEIGARMNVSVKSIEGYRDRVCNKLNVTSRAGIIMYAIQSGLVPVEINSPSESKFSKPKNR